MLRRSFQIIKRFNHKHSDKPNAFLPKNDFKITNQYSAVNPDALADGDEMGKGTGGFLDVYNVNAGAIQDILERKAEIVINEYQVNKPYTTPSA
jgi:hypothetical protein